MAWVNKWKKQLINALLISSLCNLAFATTVTHSYQHPSTQSVHKTSPTPVHANKNKAVTTQKSIAPSAAPQDLWQQVARDFTLPHDEYRPEVQAQINWFVTHPKYMQRVATHALYYMYYIHEQVVRRHLPGELVLLPMIESAYDPYAYSWVGAAGIWQMMPRTGLGFGLKQNWWYDARKAIVPSTKAALDYLVYLHNFFNGDWLLATAAYNFGEGNVQAAVSRNASVGKSTQFWALHLPLETESYVPRLLALSAIVANPHKYGVSLPFIPNRPYFGILELNQQLELTRIADMANMSSTELYELNPGFTRFATEPSSRYQLLLPVNKIPVFEANLAANTTSQIDYRHPREQLVADNTPVATVNPVYAQAAAQPSLPTSFHASPTINNPAPMKVTAKINSPVSRTYIVQPHETLYSIAKSHNLSVAELENLNHLQNSAIKSGDVLLLS